MNANVEVPSVNVISDGVKALSSPKVIESIVAGLLEPSTIDKVYEAVSVAGVSGVRVIVIIFALYELPVNV